MRQSAGITNWVRHARHVSLGASVAGSRCLCSHARPPVHIYRTTALAEHCDSYKHVNNAHYLTLFEEARWDLIEGNNFGRAEIEKTGLGPVILEANIKYLREVREGSKLVITTELDHYEGKVGSLSQVMMSQALEGEESQEVSKATFLFGLFDLKKRRLVLPTPDFMNGIGAESG